MTVEVTAKCLVALIALTVPMQTPLDDTRFNDQCNHPFESVNPTKSIKDSGLENSMDEAIKWLKCMIPHWPPARAFCAHIQKKREDGKYRVGPMITSQDAGAETLADGPSGFNMDPGNWTVINSALQRPNGNYYSSDLNVSSVQLSMVLLHEAKHDIEASLPLPKDRERWHAMNFRIDKLYWAEVLPKLVDTNKYKLEMQRMYWRTWYHLCDLEKKALKKIYG